MAFYPAAIVNAVFVAMSLGAYRMNSKSINQLWPIVEFANSHRDELEIFGIQIPILPFTQNLWRSKNLLNRWRSRKIFIEKVRSQNAEVFHFIREIAYLDIAIAIADSFL